MNAAVLVDGLVRGGLEQARAELQKYWEAVGEMPGLGTLFSNISGEKAATTPLESIPAYVEAMKKNLSPYDLPLANDNPMRRLLTDLIDFDRLRSQKEIQLTVCATNARTARRRVFTDNDLSVEALLASACLPQLFRAVDIVAACWLLPLRTGPILPDACRIKLALSATPTGAAACCRAVL